LFAVAVATPSGFGFGDCSGFFDSYGDGCAASDGGVPLLLGVGCPRENASSALLVQGHSPDAAGFLIAGAGHFNLPLNPWCFLQVSDLYPPYVVPVALSGSTDTTIPIFIPSLPSPEVYVQIAIPDPGAKGGMAVTRALEINVGG